MNNCFHCWQGEDSSDIKLEFTFDAELAKLTEEKNEAKDIDRPQPIAMPTSTIGPHCSADLLSIQSPAADDLGLKIASVKNVWERENLIAVFEQRCVICHYYCQKVIEFL